MKQLDWRNHTANCITENMDSNHCTYSVRAACGEGDKGWSLSTGVTLTMKRKEPRGECQKVEGKHTGDFVFRCSVPCIHWTSLEPGLNLLHALYVCDAFVSLSCTVELVKDFQCLIMTQGVLNCSWIPVNPSLSLSVSYRWEHTNNMSVNLIINMYTHQIKIPQNKKVRK